jgi:hypothetical protein
VLGRLRGGSSWISRARGTIGSGSRRLDGIIMSFAWGEYVRQHRWNKSLLRGRSQRRCTCGSLRIGRLGSGSGRISRVRGAIGSGSRRLGGIIMTVAWGEYARQYGWNKSLLRGRGRCGCTCGSLRRTLGIGRLRSESGWVSRGWGARRDIRACGNRLLRRSSYFIT